MSDEIYALYDLARAIDSLDQLRKFDINVQGSNIEVRWLNGSSLIGYAEMSSGIASLVSEGFDVLRAEVIKRAEQRVAKCRENLACLSPKSAGAKT